MRNLLTTEQVAQRLGVQPQTIYAYVSRGLLRRSLDDDDRRSRFDLAEVDQLARRGRPRIGTTRRGEIAVSLATSITRIASGGTPASSAAGGRRGSIEPDRVTYRGRDVVALAEHATFERVGELLWTGELPAAAAWPLPPACARVNAALRRALPRDSSPLQRLAAVAAALGPLFPLRDDLRAPAVLGHARILLAAFVDALPPLASRPARARPASLAAQLWPRLSPLAPTAIRTRLLDAALVLLADHELASSTMAVRVAASCRANPFAAVLAGLGALHGPLHGTAALGAHRLLLDAHASSAEAALAGALAAGRILGFGHPVYRGQDPRAVALLAQLRPHVARAELAVIDATIAAGTVVTSVAPNVDFTLAALAFAMKMPVGATEAIFAIARTAGWIAHALEEYAEEPLRFRARAIYVGA